MLPLTEQEPFIEKAVLMLALNKELHELSAKFQRTLDREFVLKELSNKLEDWYLLSYSDFVKELSKKKIKLSLSVAAEWEDYFLQESKKALKLKKEIQDTDDLIDEMVYELYKLTPDEIDIIKENAKR